MREIKLGDTVKCKYTGFTGVAVAKTEFINGCIQFNVQPKVKKDNKYEEDVGLDQGSLEIITTKKKKIVKRRTGGANSKSVKMKGF